MIKIIFLAT